MGPIRIALRASDPARTAEFLRAIGIALNPPDRPNPSHWYGTSAQCSVVLSVQDDDAPGIRFGVDDLEEAIGEVERLVGSGAVRRRPGGRVAEVVGPDDLAITLEQDPPEARRHDLWDVGLVDTVRAMIEPDRDRILREMELAGATAPRLAGPHLCGRPGSREFQIVVDAAADADLTRAARLVEGLGDDWMAIRLRRAADIAPDVLDRINDRAWDL